VIRATRLLLCAALVTTAVPAFLARAEDDDAGDAAVAPATPRDPRRMGIGRYIGDAAGRNLAGDAASWRAGRGARLTAIALTSATCPLCRRFTPDLVRIEAAYADRGVRFVFVNVSGTDGREEMQRQVDGGFRGLYLEDADRALAQALDARTTTEVFVVDGANTLVYRGAVSDQYGVGYAREAPRRRFLEDALDALLAGRQPAIAATSAPGCAVERAAGARGEAGGAVTYARDIARIVQNNCVECHRAGGVAPFSLESFEAVSERASMIAAVTEAGLMPPWFAAPTGSRDEAAEEGGDRLWANDRSLDPAERDALAAWIRAGKPRGDDRDLPLPRAFPPGEWTIGTPDAVFQIPEPITIKAEGVMPYQNVLVPTNLAEDRWVRGAQIVPTDKSVVHHVLVFVLPEAALTDPGLRRQAAVDESRGFFAAYVPGNDSAIYPEGMARRLPKGSVLLFQIHYTPSGRVTQDQLRLGLLFASEAPRHMVRTAGIANPRIAIPPHASNHEEHASVRLPADVRILAFLPHMHLRGKAYRYELERPGEEREVLLDIPRYDFNWQLRYVRRDPIDAPRGATIHATGWYDNSAANPANPDPDRTVRWGPQTFDEMMLGYVEYYLLTEDPNHPERLPPGGGVGGGPSFEALLSRFDASKDGRIERSEVPSALHRRFDALDRNRDGVLTAEDFAQPSPGGPR
jgi:mono/diheme cytochrome c family protein